MTRRNEIFPSIYRAKSASGLGLAAALIGLAGCSEEREPTPSKDSAYLFATSTFTPEGEEIGTLLALPSLEADVVPDYSNSVEFASRALLYGREGDNAGYVGLRDTPEITKWSLDENGAFVQGDTISFLNLGVSGAPYHSGFVQILSSDKAYALDLATSQVIIWNPREMKIRGSIEIPVGEVSEDLYPFVGDRIVVSGNFVQFMISYNSEDGMLYADHSRFIAIDTRTDEVVSSIDDARIQDSYIQSKSPNGTVYFSNATYTSIIEPAYGNGLGARSSVVRVLPGKSEPDPDFAPDLMALTGGRPAGAFLAIDDETAFIQAFDGIEDVTQDNFWERTGQGNRWWRWKIGEDTAELVPDQTPGGGVNLFLADGRTFVQRAAADGSESTLVELLTNGTMKDAITVKGYPFGMLRVRDPK